jgi:SAM-dependent methyltransferase
VHIEQGAIEALRARYAVFLPKSGSILDLMSSWRSHLPSGLGPVVGLGMNAAEMADNPQLNKFLVHDLNVDPTLPFDDDAFVGAVCSVSVQYLTQPVEVFSEVRRVLQPGSPFVVAFSNRCFFTKAVAIWLAGTDDQHRALVRGYFQAAGFDQVNDEQVPTPDDPLFVVSGYRGT